MVKEVRWDQLSVEQVTSENDLFEVYHGEKISSKKKDYVVGIKSLVARRANDRRNQF